LANVECVHWFGWRYASYWGTQHDVLGDGDELVGHHNTTGTGNASLIIDIQAVSTVVPPMIILPLVHHAP
jgi:TRAP-type mannitol/chloroaromatic compound transport system substrate-binding protein